MSRPGSPSFSFTHGARARGTAALALLSLVAGAGLLAPRVDAAGARARSETTRLVAVHAVRHDRQARPARAAGWSESPISWSIWQALRRTPVFDDVGVWVPHAEMALDGARGVRLSAIEASSSLLDVLDVRLEHGRLFVPREDVEPSRSVLLSYRAWHRHFGRQGDITGRSIRLRVRAQPFGASEVFEVVGVLAAGVQLPGGAPDVILPVGRPPAELASFAGFAVARLASDVSMAEASSVVSRFVGALDPRGVRGGLVVPIEPD